MDCSICGSPSGPDALCSSHKRLLATCTDLTPEQVRSRRASASGLVLVDMFGVIHPLGDRARIGREPDACELAILHASISSNHALLTASGDIVTVVDRESLNGTFVDDQLVTTQRTFTANDTLLRFGAVSFLVCPDAHGHVGAAPMGRRTVPRGGGVTRAGLLVRGIRFDLAIGRDAAALTGDGREIGLSLMEGRLLRMLLLRAAEGQFLSTADLLSELGFGARAADGENVRELVRRLRRKLAGSGLGDLIESRRHAGYRIASHASLV